MNLLVQASYPLPNDELLLLLNKEGVELVDLRIQHFDELSLDLGARLGFRDELHQLLEVLVGQKLVPPFWESLLYLLLQPFAKLHVS